MDYTANVACPTWADVRNSNKRRLQPVAAAAADPWSCIMQHALPTPTPLRHPSRNSGSLGSLVGCVHDRLTGDKELLSSDTIVLRNSRNLRFMAGGGSQDITF